MKLNGTIGFLGFGNMGGAILRGLLETATIGPEQAVVYDVDAEKCAAASALGVKVAASMAELGQACNMLLLAVKPQTMGEALEELQASLAEDALVISIAAGISTSYLEERLGAGRPIIRTMPNTPAMVGAGAAAVALNGNCTPEDGETARTIFESMGICEIVPESAMDVVTALSGSGPAYFFYLTECLVEAATAHGLPQEQAARLAGQTMLGAGRLLQESGEPASVLRERVTSKGGTTAAALDAFRSKDFAGVIAAGVDAAVKRSKELGQ